MKPKKISSSHARQISELMNSIEERKNKRSPKYFTGTKAVQRESVEKLMAMICRFSELPDNNENQSLRWLQVRFKAAIVARVFGIMDSDTFDAECGRHTGWLAAVMQQR
jgi:hypothetical protein